MAKLDDFDNIPADAKLPGKYASENASQLDEGDYEVELTGGSIKNIAKDGDEERPVVIFSMKVLKSADEPVVGWPIEKAFFMADKEGVSNKRARGDVLADFKTMGFDTENWQAPDRPFSKQLKIALEVMKGVRLTMKVKHGKDRKFPYLNLNKRLVDDKPITFGAAEMVVSGSFGVAEETPATTPEGDPIPF